MNLLGKLGERERETRSSASVAFGLIYAEEARVGRFETALKKGPGFTSENIKIYIRLSRSLLGNSISYKVLKQVNNLKYFDPADSRNGKITMGKLPPGHRKAIGRLYRAMTGVAGVSSAKRRDPNRVLFARGCDAVH